MRWIVIGILFGLFSFSFLIQFLEKIESAPAVACNLSPDERFYRHGNAGCLIPFGDRVLLVRDRISRKLGPPAGRRKQNELSACTAHRETLEETGVEVVIEKHLASFDDARFFLYECSPDESAKLRFERPEWARVEIDEILLIDPFTLKKDEYRWPEHFETARKIMIDLVSR